MAFVGNARSVEEGSAVDPAPQSRRDEHSADTRRALVDAARLVFAEKGYGTSGTAEILDRARVARGGMYHHFPTKQALFREVLDLVEYEFIHRLASEEMPGENVWEEIGSGCQRFLDL